MSRTFFLAIVSMALSACYPQQRAGPPAPIITAGKQPEVAEPKEQAAPESQPQPEPRPTDSAEVYAYRAPSTAPDSAAIPDQAPRAGASDTAMDSAPSRSEQAPAPTVSPASPEQESPPELVAYAEPSPPVPGLPPQAETLVKKAERQRQARDYVGAAANLERALGIQPQEPYIWNRLARVRTEQGLYSQAANLAARSNDLAGDQENLKRDNWSMIAAARRAAGDTAGAIEAERKARGQ